MIQLRDVVAVWPSSWWLPIKRFLLLRMQVLIAIIGKHAIKKKNDGRGNEGDTGATAWSRGRRSLSTEVCCATITGTSSGWTLSTTPTVGFVKRMPRNCLPRTTHNQVGLATCSKVPPIDAYWLLQSDVWKRACSGTCRELLLESKYASGGEDTTIVEQNLRVQILSSVDLLFVRKFYQQILVVCRCVFFWQQVSLHTSDCFLSEMFLPLAGAHFRFYHNSICFAGPSRYLYLSLACDRVFTTVFLGFVSP